MSPNTSNVTLHREVVEVAMKYFFLDPFEVPVSHQHLSYLYTSWRNHGNACCVGGAAAITLNDKRSGHAASRLRGKAARAGSPHDFVLTWPILISPRRFKTRRFSPSLALTAHPNKWRDYFLSPSSLASHLNANETVRRSRLCPPVGSSVGTVCSETSDMHHLHQTTL